MDPFIADILFEYRRYKALADRAIAQVDDATFFHRPTELVNPVALIVKHVAGNLTSRFTDFLTTDGDKPTRDRDGEFRVGEYDTRAGLLAAWERGWQCAFDAVQALEPADLAKTVTIRGEPHTVMQALLRSATHSAYHIGQILYVVRLLHPDGAWLTVAPGESATHKANYRGG